MDDNARGGNDTVTGVFGYNTLYGDAYDMHGHSRGGNDVLIGSSAGGVPTGSHVDLYGDAFNMDDDAQGGNDQLTGVTNAPNYLYGDAYTMACDAKGGDDVLTAGGGPYATNYLYGDANEMDGNAIGGNDTLISSTGTDYMWGDAATMSSSAKGGADTFVFAPNNGTDFVEDFRQTDNDKIDLTAFGFHDISDLNMSGNGANTVIDFGGGNTVTLVGIPDPSVLTDSDFIFGPLT
jgi:hypothetical protein